VLRDQRGHSLGDNLDVPGPGRARRAAAAADNREQDRQKNHDDRDTRGDGIPPGQLLVCGEKPGRSRQPDRSSDGQRYARGGV